MITERQIVNDLQQLGVKDGDHIGLGISFRKIGRVEGGAETLINALMTAVGPGGTIMIPSYTRAHPQPENGTNAHEGCFDPRLTPAYTGIVPEVLRQREGSIRSWHPQCSVVSLGRLASYLTENHDADAPAYLPFSRLASCKGKVLSIGIGDKLVGFRHEAQYLAGLLDVVPLRSQTRYRDKNGQIGVFVRRDTGGCVTRLPALTKTLRQQGLVTDGKIGEADSILVDAEEGLRSLTDQLKSNPTSNLCDKVSCLWCREIERRMGLYGSIEEPKYFQSSRPVRSLIALMNWARIKKLNHKHSVSPQ